MFTYNVPVRKRLLAVIWVDEFYRFALITHTPDSLGIAWYTGYWTASWKRGNYPGFADGFVEGLKTHG